MKKQTALICPTSMGVRITPADRQPVHVASQFLLEATSAESNLWSRGIQIESSEVPQGDAWGYRHQFNIADYDIDRIFGTEGVEILHLSVLLHYPDSGRHFKKYRGGSYRTGTFCQHSVHQLQHQLGPDLRPFRSSRYGCRRRRHRYAHGSYCGIHQYLGVS